MVDRIKSAVKNKKESCKEYLNPKTPDRNEKCKTNTKIVNAEVHKAKQNFCIGFIENMERIYGANQ